MGASFLGLGLLGAVINSITMRKWRRYKVNSFIGLLGAIISYFLSFYYFRKGNVIGAIIAPGFLGFFEIPMRGHDTGHMCEVAYPASKKYRQFVGEPVIIGFSSLTFAVISTATV